MSAQFFIGFQSLFNYVIPVYSHYALTLLLLLAGVCNGHSTEVLYDDNVYSVFNEIIVLSSKEPEQSWKFAIFAVKGCLNISERRSIRNIS